jgi:hypothetical protein
LAVGRAESGTDARATGWARFAGSGSITNTVSLHVGALNGGASTNATGTLIFGPNVTSYTAGTPSSRIAVEIGVNNSSVAAGADAAGTLTAATATSIYGTTLQIGRKTTTTAGTAYGLLDLSAAPSATVSLNNTTHIGVGRNATGSMILPSGAAFTTSSTVTIGDDNAGNNAGGTGAVTLNGANLTLTSAASILTIGVSGSLLNNISDTSSGVTIDRNNSGAFSIASFLTGGAGMTLNFDDPNFIPTASNPYWGFRWQGNFVSTLTSYVNEPGSAFTSGDGRIDVNIVGGSNLQWSDFNIGTYVDGSTTYTYIGFTDFEVPLAVPEPSTVFLLLVGGGWLWWRRWQKGNA